MTDSRTITKDELSAACTDATLWAVDHMKGDKEGMGMLMAGLLGILLTGRIREILFPKDGETAPTGVTLQ